MLADGEVVVLVARPVLSQAAFGGQDESRISVAGKEFQNDVGSAADRKPRAGS